MVEGLGLVSRVFGVDFGQELCLLLGGGGVSFRVQGLRLGWIITILYFVLLNMLLNPKP